MAKATWYNDPYEDETHADTRTDKQATAVNMEYTSSNECILRFDNMKYTLRKQTNNIHIYCLVQATGTSYPPLLGVPGNRLASFLAIDKLVPGNSFARSWQQNWSYLAIDLVVPGNRNECF